MFFLHNCKQYIIKIISKLNIKVSKTTSTVENINFKVIHCDETGVQINGKRNWLHVTSNDTLTYFFAHKNRGTEVINAAGIYFLDTDVYISYK